jgi:hypothetical protein
MMEDPIAERMLEKRITLMMATYSALLFNGLTKFDMGRTLSVIYLKPEQSSKFNIALQGSKK